MHMVDIWKLKSNENSFFDLEKWKLGHVGQYTLRSSSSRNAVESKECHGEVPLKEMLVHPF